MLAQRGLTPPAGVPLDDPELDEAALLAIVDAAMDAEDQVDLEVRLRTLVPPR